MSKLQVLSDEETKRDDAVSDRALTRTTRHCDSRAELELRTGAAAGLFVSAQLAKVQVETFVSRRCARAREARGRLGYSRQSP